MNTVERIKSICKERKIPLYILEKDCGFANGYISQLKKGSVPDDRLKKIADYFKLPPEYLTTGNDPTGERYYFDNDAKEYAQFLFENPEYRVLFDASRKVKKEDLQFVKDFLDKLNTK